MSDEKDAAARVLANTAANRRMAEHRFFFAYFLDVWKATPLWVNYKRGLTIFRRIRIVTILFRVLTLLFTLLQTGTLVILSTVILLVLLPLVLVLMLAILITAAVESRRSNRYLAQALAAHRVCVLFPSDEARPFFVQYVNRLRAEGFAVIVVSPYLLSSRGIEGISQKCGFYSTLRCEAPSIYLVRRYYFFSLRRRVLCRMQTAYLY